MTATSPTKKASPAEDGKKTVAKLPTEAPMSPKSIHQAAKDVIETKKAHMEVDPPAARAAAPSSQLQPMRVKRLSPTATVPTRGSASAAGFDLYASRESVVPARGKAIVATDISIALPAGTYGRIAPRSGLAAKHSIDVGAGVIDVDYRGAVGVILFNFSDADFSIAVGDRIAQLILEEVRMAPALEVDELDETVRGEGGFGSTGGFNGAAQPQA